MLVASGDLCPIHALFHMSMLSFIGMVLLSLTGESVPVTKTPLANPKLLGVHARDPPFSLKEHSRHVLFCGTRVIQTRFYDKQKVRAVVLRTGKWSGDGNIKMTRLGF